MKKVNSDASTTVTDSFTITHNVADSTAASFEASRTEGSYKIPTRFTCTTPGKHISHHWDFGDGTTSSHSNPLHTFPRPTDSSGWATHTVKFKVETEDRKWHETQQEIIVYQTGGLEVNLPSLGDTTSAVFVRPDGETLDEVKHFFGIIKGEGQILDRFYPVGQYKVTVKPLGYPDWKSGLVVVLEDKGVMVNAFPGGEGEPCDYTVGIGSSPPGADVTLTTYKQQFYGVVIDKTYTGTAPFFLSLTCPGYDDIGMHTCMFDYKVDFGGQSIKGTADLCAGYNGKSVENCKPCVRTNIYVHIDEAAQAEPGLTEYGHVIVREPSDQLLVKGGEARLSVSARSHLPLHYRWYEGESGDISRPIYGATGQVYFTPALHDTTQYWVRVYSGQYHSDSRTALVSVAEQGPGLDSTTPSYAIPAASMSLHGSGFNPDDIEENLVFFDEYKAIVQSVETDKVVVKIPKSISDKDLVEMHIKVNGVWGNSMSLEVQESDQESDNDSFCFIGSVMPGR